MDNHKSRYYGARAKLVRTAFYFGRFASAISGIKISLFFTDCFASMYSGWLYKNFAGCGDKLHISYPLHYSGLKYITVGANFVAGPRLRIEAHDLFLDDAYHPEVIIGDNVTINFDCHIGCINSIHIGNDVLIASKVLIIDHLHGETTLKSIELPPSLRKLSSKGPIKIHDNVLIGEGCIIMPGVTIGKNCIVGSNAVVTRSFDANTVIAGNPARAIRELK